MSKITFPIFTDPRYHTETTIEIETSQVVSVAEKTVKLFMAGKHRVTEVTLQSGQIVLLKGEVARQIEGAKRQPQ